MNREVYVRICESLGVKRSWATRLGGRLAAQQSAYYSIGIRMFADDRVDIPHPVRVYFIL